MKLYLSNKSNLNLNSNSNSNVDNLYKNKNYDRTKKKKKSHVDNRGFGFCVKIYTNYFFILYMADKDSIFLEKNKKMQPMSSSLGNNKFLFDMLYINLLNLVWF